MNLEFTLLNQFYLFDNYGQGMKFKKFFIFLFCKKIFYFKSKIKKKVIHCDTFFKNFQNYLFFLNNQ